MRTSIRCEIKWLPFNCSDSDEMLSGDEDIYPPFETLPDRLQCEVFVRTILFQIIVRRTLDVLMQTATVVHFSLEPCKRGSFLLVTSRLDERSAASAVLLNSHIL